MDFDWSEPTEARYQEIVAFARTALNDDVVSRDREGRFSRDFWDACGRFGVQSMAVPARYAPDFEEVDFLTAIRAMEGLGYGCEDTGLTFALSAHMWTVTLPIVRFGSEEQKQRFLPRLADGSWIGAHAVTETEAGSDAFAMKTTAERRDGGYVLSGEKRLVTLAPIADLALVFATTDPSLGQWGITAFLVERETPGLETSPVREKMGLRTVPLGEVQLRDCFVPDSNRLGKEGAGAAIAHHSLVIERCSILASQLGAMQRQLDKTIEYAKTRRQFGRPIGKFQSVANRIVDMRLRLESARLLLYKAAWLVTQGKPATLESALLKLHVSESFVSSSLDAIRTFGGNGYLTEWGIERDLRDAVGGILYAGTSDIQRSVVARLLGL
jgi:alkylation response protein AidB-like acyl-CoA dehydrogenase